jgi:hypothetical protein
MKELSACAEAVPTTLWFPKEGDEEIRVEPEAPKLNAEPEKKLKLDADPATCKENHPDNQRLLIACAQCTTCFCLIRHLWRRWEERVDGDPPAPTPKPNDPESPYYEMYMKLKKVWDQLKIDPYCMVDRDRTSIELE